MNKTHGEFKDVLAIAASELRPVCESLRNLIASLHGGFTEVVWPKHGIASFGVGPKKMSEHYAYIGVQGSHINLGFYHGASLSDPEGLLEGSGRKLRHVKLSDAAATRTPALAALLRQAIEDRAHSVTEA